MKQQYSTTKQANLMFLCVSIFLMIGSSILIPTLGIGTNLWINEYIWILAPVLIFAKLGKLSTKNTFKLKKISKSNKMISVLSAVCICFFSNYLSKISDLFLNHTVGSININLYESVSSVTQSLLLLIGMVVLAPICEELLFRGFIQSAYENYSRKYGFVITAVLFGMFHILNGITQVIPTFMAGLVFGYLVHRTGSIITSMLAHMAFNVSSIVFVSFMGFANMSTVPLWFHLTGFGGLAAVLLLISKLKGTDEEAIKEVKEEEGNYNIKEKIEETGDYNIKETISVMIEENNMIIEEAPTVTKYSLGSKITFALSCIFVLIIGAFELYLRLNI